MIPHWTGPAMVFRKTLFISDNLVRLHRNDRDRRPARPNRASEKGRATNRAKIRASLRPVETPGRPWRIYLPGRGPARQADCGLPQKSYPKMTITTIPAGVGDRCAGAGPLK